jgi:hypothetical protein
VGPALSGAITVSPQPLNPNQTATLSVAPTNGQGGYKDYQWKIDGIDVPNGKTRTITTSFPTTGHHTAQVSFDDNASPSHPGTVTQTFDVVAPTPPEPGAPPPTPVTPPPCTKKLDFALSELTTEGCFTKVAADPEQWATTDHVELNGISFDDSGQRFLITFPTAAEPGGHVTSEAAAIQLDRFIPFSGSVD